jgi:hypothetical protein
MFLHSSLRLGGARDKQHRNHSYQNPHEPHPVIFLPAMPIPYRYRSSSRREKSALQAKRAGYRQACSAEVFHEADAKHPRRSASTTTLATKVIDPAYSPKETGRESIRNALTWHRNKIARQVKLAENAQS